MPRLVTAIATALLMLTAVTTGSSAQMTTDDDLEMAKQIGWFQKVRCSEFVQGTKVDIHTLERVFLWAIGFAQGVTTVPPKPEQIRGLGIKGILFMMTRACSSNPDQTIMQAATDVMSAQYNLMHIHMKKAVDLLDPLPASP